MGKFFTSLVLWVGVLCVAATAQDSEHVAEYELQIAQITEDLDRIDADHDDLIEIVSRTPEFEKDDSDAYRGEAERLQRELEVQNGHWANLMSRITMGNMPGIMGTSRMQKMLDLAVGIESKRVALAATHAQIVAKTRQDEAPDEPKEPNKDDLFDQVKARAASLRQDFEAMKTAHQIVRQRVDAADQISPEQAQQFTQTVTELLRKVELDIYAIRREVIDPLFDNDLMPMPGTPVVSEVWALSDEMVAEQARMQETLELIASKIAEEPEEPEEQQEPEEPEEPAPEPEEPEELAPEPAPAPSATPSATPRDDGLIKRLKKMLSMLEKLAPEPRENAAALREAIGDTIEDFKVGRYKTDKTADALVDGFGLITRAYVSTPYALSPAIDMMSLPQDELEQQLWSCTSAHDSGTTGYYNCLGSPHPRGIEECRDTYGTDPSFPAYVCVESHFASERMRMGQVYEPQTDIATMYMATKFMSDPSVREMIENAPEEDFGPSTGGKDIGVGEVGISDTSGEDDEDSGGD